MSDIRLGKPSASAFSILAECPGQPALVRTLPPRIDDDDEDVARGSRIHKSLETNDISTLQTEEEIETHNASVKFEKSLFEQWLTENEIEASSVEGPFQEQRLWLNNPTTLEAVLSGQLDIYWVAKPHALIIDRKTGWNPNLPNSNTSHQLRVQAVLLWREFDDISKIRVSYCKPKLKAEATDHTDYTGSDLAYSEQSILYHLWEADQPNAPLRAGDWCNWCKAKADCVQAGAYSLLPSVIAHNALSNGDPVAAVQQLVPADLVKIWSASTVIDKIFDAVKARLKSMTPEQLAELGLKRGKGKTTRKVNNARAVINALKAMNLSEEKIDEILKLSVPDIAMLLRREVGMSAQGAPQWCRDNLAAWLNESVSDAPIERITE